MSKNEAYEANKKRLEQIKDYVPTIRNDALINLPQCVTLEIDTVETQLDCFAWVLGYVGYAIFERCKPFSKTFELTRLIPLEEMAPDQCPYPIVRLTTVLWRRRAAVAAEKTFSAFRKDLTQSD